MKKHPGGRAVRKRTTRLGAGLVALSRKNHFTTETTRKHSRKCDGGGVDDDQRMKGPDQIPREVGVLKSQILSAKQETKIATWNVRTLYQSGKLDQVLREFDNYGLDMLGISEMRWTGSGKIKKEGKTIIYSGGEKYHRRGVGLILNDAAGKSLIGWKAINERIITARFKSRHTKTTVVQVYAPIEDAEEEDKNEFYDALQGVFDELPKHDLKILAGDFNAQICGNREGFESVVGPFGMATNTSDNGDRMLGFCNLNNMCISNTFFKHKRIHKYTWRSPDTKTNNEIDYICINKRWSSGMKDVRAFRGADVGSDHNLLVAKLQLRLKKIAKPMVQKPYAIAKFSDEKAVERYQQKLEEALVGNDIKTMDVEDSWTHLEKCLRNSADETIGRRRGKKSEQWISEGSWKLIDERKAYKAKRERQNDESERAKADAEYRAVDKAVKKSCRADKKMWMEKKAEEAEEAAANKDSRALFRIVRDISGKSSGGNVPVKDKNGKTLLSEQEQSERWVEHFRETLNQPEPDTLVNFDVEEAVEELDVKTGAITVEEVETAVKKIKRNKAAGEDQICGELLKYGGECLNEKLCELLNKCWEEEAVPETWRNGIIVKLPKKGNLADCNNWRGVTLLSVPGKVFCIVLLNRLKQRLDEILREEQAGFRAGRSTMDQILVLRTIIEQCVEMQKTVVINFIDFRKAFDSVHRDSLWRILGLYGVPRKFIAVFKNMYMNSNCKVRMESGNSAPFDIVTGVRQGCILSPLLFIVAIDYIMKKTTEVGMHGLKWVGDVKIADLDFADDIALLDEDEVGNQDMTNKLVKNAKMVGLRLNVPKTKCMAVGMEADASINIEVDGEKVEKVCDFVYLGSCLEDSGAVEKDVRTRIGKAGATFQKMKNVWRASKLTLKIKLRMYNAIILPTVLYGSETWKLNKQLGAKLDSFHRRCLRSILKITWRDKVTNEVVMKRTGASELKDIIKKRRLHLLGHVLRMGEQRYPKHVMTWTPEGGKRKRGRPKLTWKRMVEQDLKAAGLTLESATQEALNREEWRELVAQCVKKHGRT